MLYFDFNILLSLLLSERSTCMGNNMNNSDELWINVIKVTLKAFELSRGSSAMHL